MSERETREFMSVDSFSQLPFMSSREKPPNPSIRLFGRDFPPEASRATIIADPLGKFTVKAKPGNTSPAASAIAGHRRRKFECQYCFRNFPTSQALGGHQNAHKRERQHAKRSQLQASHAAESHFHGFLSRGGMPMPPTTGFAFDQSPQPHYPSWNLSAGAGRGGRFYGGLGSVRQPIYGGQLPAGVWRPPVVHGYHQNHFTVTDPLPLALFNEKERKATAVKGVGSSTSSSTLTSPRERHGHDLKDDVSLDLHL